jgi:hypothetical protein
VFIVWDNYSLFVEGNGYGAMKRSMYSHKPQQKRYQSYRES